MNLDAAIREVSPKTIEEWDRLHFEYWEATGELMPISDEEQQLRDSED